MPANDTGYAGMVWHKDELWGSYYSNHEDKEDNPPPNRHVELPTAIYLARIRFDQLNTSSSLPYRCWHNWPRSTLPIPSWSITASRALRSSSRRILNGR
jgi:hypothetical protein